MSISATVTEDATQTIQRLALDLKLDIAVVLKRLGRLEAVSFARSTQPYTRGEDFASSLAQGKGAVERDIRRLFKTGGAVSDCTIVTAASKAYQESQDFIAEFIRDKIATIAGGKIKKQELNSEFTIWYMNAHGKHPPNLKELHYYMERIFGKIHYKHGGWLGVCIKYERDDAKDDGEQFDISIDF